MTIKINDEQNAETIEAALREAEQRAEQEYVRYQVAGRALTDEEQARSEVLQNCLGYIRKALEVLGAAE